MADLVKQNYERWMASPKVSEEDKKALLALTPEEKDAAFFKDVEFGTAGMRGFIGPGTNKMNDFTVKKATVAFGMYLLEKIPGSKEMGIVISHDNRFKSREFTLLSAKILNEMGIKAYIFDALRPVPELSFAVRKTKAAGGIMITASHNPKEYNGYKIYDETGCQLVPKKIARMLEILASLPDELTVEAPKAEKPAETIMLGKEIDDEYVELVKGTQVNPDLPKQGFKIVYSPQHGASYENAMRIFKDCGYEIYPVEKQCIHDPAFGGTESPNPENAEAFTESIKLAKEIGATLTVMTDPDGDRCGLCYLSSKGTYERLTGNQSAALLMEYIFSERQKQGKLHKDGVMYDTVVTSDLGRKIAKAYGLKNESFLTGFKYIGNRIDYYEKQGYGPYCEFGYEESYGCIVEPFVRDKDGIQAILLYSEMALHYYLQGIPLDVAYENLEKKYGYHMTITKSVSFFGSSGASEMAKIMEKAHNSLPHVVDGMKVVVIEDYVKLEKQDLRTGEKTKLDYDKSEVVRLIFEDTSWIAIRPSGTEPKCKFYVEVFQKDGNGLKERTEHLIATLLESLGVKA
ncbi:MAG: phospho-sugar mutase [Bacilli bacterium]|nr:phospho-sugar mutase [Bacilli bacterium]